MKILLKLFPLILLCLAPMLFVGCGGDDGPVTPATTDEVPTSEEPPPGEEEPAYDEGP